MKKKYFFFSFFAFCKEKKLYLRISIKKSTIMGRFFIFLILFFASIFVVNSQTISVPLSAIWFDSEGQLQDNQSNSSEKIQKSSDSRDSVISLNFHRVKSFVSGVSSIRSLYDLGVTSRLTVVVVFESSDTLSEHGIWSVVRDGNQVTGLTDKRLLRQNGDYIYPVQRRGIPLINTSMQAFSKIRGEAGDNYFSLGEARLSDTLSSFSGTIAECLVFDRFLKKAEALKVETYLAVKYGITLISSDYISGSGVVLWSYEENKEYSHGIAGLGRDNLLGLSQKQGSSSEESGLLTLGVGDYSALNKDNAFILNDGDFLLWGHNDAGLNLDGFSGEAYPLFERKWLIQSTNSANNTFSTWIRFRLPEQYRDSSRICYLAIDRSGRGDFSFGNVEYIAQSQVDTFGYVYFSDVVWHSKDVFTFSVKEVEDTVLEEDSVEDAFSQEEESLSDESSENALFESSAIYYNVCSASHCYPLRFTAVANLRFSLPC